MWACVPMFACMHSMCAQLSVHAYFPLHVCACAWVHHCVMKILRGSLNSLYLTLTYLLISVWRERSGITAALFTHKHTKPHHHLCCHSHSNTPQISHLAAHSTNISSNTKKEDSSVNHKVWKKVEKKENSFLLKNKSQSSWSLKSLLLIIYM